MNLKEEVTPAILDGKGRIDIHHEGTRDSINAALNAIQSDCLTPYIGLERVRKALAYYHIHIPGVQFLEGEHGIKAFEVSQFGIKTGMNNNGEVVTADDSPYFIVFEWMYAYSGFFNISAALVDADRLQKRLDRFEQMRVPLEEEEKKDDKEFIRKQYARAYADSNHKMTDDAKKSVKKRMKELSEARLKKNELAAMQDAIRMQASLQGRKVKIPKPKARKPAADKKYYDSMKMDHWRMKQQVRKTSFLKPEKKEEKPSMLVPVINPKTGTNVVAPPRPYRMPSLNPDEISSGPIKREGGPSGPASKTMNTHKDSISHTNARLKTGIPRPNVETDFEKFIKKYNETGKKEWIEKAKRWAAADYAYHKPDYPDSAELEYKLRKQSIEALEASLNPSKIAKIGGMVRGLFKKKSVNEEQTQEDSLKEGILRTLDKKLGSPLQKRRIDKMNKSGKENRSSKGIEDRHNKNMPGYKNTALTGGVNARETRNYANNMKLRVKQLAADKKKRKYTAQEWADRKNDKD